MLFSDNFILSFVVLILVLAGDFWWCKNVSGRMLVGLRWWNDVDALTGESRWVFESKATAGRYVLNFKVTYISDI